jgi:hypothetical protein
MDFGFTDPNDSAANALTAVTITTIPGAGSVTLSAVAVTAGQSISVADITAGNLKFAPVANANGAGYASFTFQVQDDGGTANSGVDLDASPNTMTVNVTAVNDAPAGANNTVTTLEDTQYTFAAVDFGFTDPNDSAANALTALTITTIPGTGSVTLSAVAVTVGQSISVADITAGNLKFAPVANANGAGYASFTFQVQDDGGTANSGVDLSASANTMTVNVTAVNDAPAGTNNTVTALEDAQYTFAAADFGFTDPNDSPANALTAVTITTIPGAGSVTLFAVAVTAGQSISVADITAGNLKFAPVANANGAGYASFTFQVQDDGGTANSGVDLDASANTITVNVTAVNDAPAGTNNTITTLEDTQYTFAAVDFGFTDPNDSSANALTAVNITTIPAAGSLTLSGVAVTAGQTITVANINSGDLKFAGAANANGTGYASFMFEVQDDGGSANSGVDLDASANTMTVNVTAVNDAPAGNDTTVSTLEDTVYTFAVADFGFSDVNDTPSNNLAAVNITSLPGAGSLTLSGVAVVAGQSVALASISAGGLTFTPGADANGASYASFIFRVQDDGGTANGGANLAAAANTMTIDVTAVNDAPVIAQNTLTLAQGDTVQLSAGQLGATDVDNPAAGLLFSVSGVMHGQFELSTGPTVPVLAFTQAQVGAGQVLFVHDASNSAPTYDISVSDGTLSVGPVAASISFNLYSAVSAPAASGPVVPPSLPSQPTTPAQSTEPAPKPAPVPSASDSGAASGTNTGEGNGGGGGGSGDGSGAGAAAAASGALNTQSNPVDSPARVEMRTLALAAPKTSGAREMHSLPPLELSLLIQGTDPQSIKFEGSAQADWSISTAFNDETMTQRKEEISVLLDSAQMGGVALSVGVVWWASRLAGVVGSLMASIPAWRQLDPLPVIGRGDDAEDAEWHHDQDDLDADADELAISMFLDAHAGEAVVTG